MSDSRHDLQVLIVGATRVGKTAVVNRLVYNHFSSQYTYLEFATSYSKKWQFRADQNKPIGQSSNRAVALKLWDIPSRKRFCPPASLADYFKRADVAVFVVDRTKTLNKQKPRLDILNKSFKEHRADKTIPILVINKDEYENEAKAPLSNDDIETLKKEILGNKYAKNILKISAKNNKNINILGDFISNPRLDLDTYAYFSDAHNYFTGQNTNDNEIKKTDLELIKNDFQRYLKQAEASVLADLGRKIDNETAKTFAKESMFLAKKVASNRVKTQDIERFHNVVRPAVSKSERLGRIVGGLIGAALGIALGLFIGAMIGAGLGPGAALTALAAAATAAVIGATVCAAIGGAALGYFGSQFSLWHHPLSKMERTAKKLVPFDEESITVVNNVLGL